jgi:hypothetical protein
VDERFSPAPDPSSFSPNAFLRARRPERFSDSVVDEGPALDRSALEYHLDTLTSRGQETLFEHFARRLAEREVCPNLLPQTGPTGGGDSKVDAETYPVADALALAWYVGEDARAAAAERWAFAFSAKKQWAPKVRSDVAKLVKTGRGYTRAFFVTNQFVSDRRRGQLEDELRKKHGVDVRILDRTWILERVFAGRHEALAVAELGMMTELRRAARAGPRDTERAQELEACEARIPEALREGRTGRVLVDDALEAAELARGLERPRTEVEGRFARAAQIAAQYGTTHQQLRAAYEHAWTTFFWYEDAATFAAQYGAVEAHALGTRNAYELELLANLWLVLRGAVAQGVLPADGAGVDRRRSTLERELRRLAGDGERRSSALQARLSLLLVELATSTRATAPAVIRKLGALVEEAEGLVGFPVTPLVDLLTELGDLLGGEHMTDVAFDAVAAAVARREGALTGARLYLRRGVQQLDAGRPYDAIRALGRSFGGLYTHESRHELVLALCACGYAYERVGLLWAARGTLLSAASVATNDLWTYQDVTRRQAMAYGQLKRVELQLGRVPHVLAWHELDQAVRGVLAEQGHDPEQLGLGDLTFDAVVGMLFLRAEVWTLKPLIGLPDVLERLGLPMAAVALRYALGHEDTMPLELVRPLDPSALSADAGVAASAAGPAPLLEFFRRWRDQPARDDLPPEPMLGEGVAATLEAVVLGCRVTVTTTNRAPCVELGESFLAALEALLATAGRLRFGAVEPAITINVLASDVADVPFTFERVLRDGRPAWEVRCRPFDPFHVDGERQQAIKGRLWDLLVDVLGHAFHPGSGEEGVKTLLGDEQARRRALDFTGSFVTLGNVLGEAPRTRLTAWTDPAARAYPVRRAEPWDADDRRAATAERHAAEAAVGAPTAFHPGPPPDGLRDPDTVKHTEIAVVSLIRGPLWDAAKWAATAFQTWTDHSAPPVLALIFKHGAPAAQIIAGWRKELGARDEREALRLSILRGITRANPHAYRVVVGSDPGSWLSSSSAAGTPNVKLTMAMCRMHAMEPTSDMHLRRFLESYAHAGEYALTCGTQTADGQGFRVALSDYWITKRALHVRDAWQVGPHEWESVGIHADEDPVLPNDRPETDIPVLALLRDRRTRRAPGADAA